MIDKLDLEVPVRQRFNPAFKKVWDSPEADDLLKRRRTKLYEVTADLRPIGVPAQISIGHRHHKNLGPKLEIMEAGMKCYSDLAQVHGEIFEGEPWEDAILRVDLTADVRDLTVSDVGMSMRCKFKAITRQIHGDQSLTTIQRYGAQTQMHGLKPRQIRIYNKTLHRLQELLPALHRLQRRRGEELSTFEEVFGYDPWQIITRVERQMGARESRDVWQVNKFGEIHRLAAVDPFERLTFLADTKPSASLAEVKGQRLVLVRYMRQQVEREGYDAMRSFVRECYPNAAAFRKFMDENEHLILSGAPVVTKELLTREFHRTIALQLAA